MIQDPNPGVKRSSCFYSSDASSLAILLHDSIRYAQINSRRDI